MKEVADLFKGLFGARDAEINFLEFDTAKTVAPEDTTQNSSNAGKTHLKFPGQ
jgi:hypothetical protein